MASAESPLTGFFEKLHATSRALVASRLFNSRIGGCAFHYRPGLRRWSNAASR
jgi:hypothetical protein